MTPKFLNNLNDGAGIDAGIKWVRAAGKNFDSYVHQIAVAIIRHTKEHGNCTRALQLVLAMPKSARRSALITWFRAFSPINVTMAKDVKDCKVGLLKNDSPRYNAFNVEGAALTPYYEYEKEPGVDTEFTSGEMNDLIERMVKRIMTKLEEGKVAANDRDNIEAKLAVLRTVGTIVYEGGAAKAPAPVKKDAA